MVLLQSILALALAAAGLGVFMLLRWADRLEATSSGPATVHAFPSRRHPRSQGQHRDREVA